MKRKEIEDTPRNPQNKKLYILDPPEISFAKKSTTTLQKPKKATPDNDCTILIEQQEPKPIESYTQLFEVNEDKDDDIYNINIFIKFPKPIKNYRVNLIRSENGTHEKNS